jgi:hypothetical protein
VEKYEREVSRLLLKKKALEEEQSAIKTADLRSWRYLFLRIAPLVSVGIMLFVTGSVVRTLYPFHAATQQVSRLLDITLTVFLAVLGGLIGLTVLGFGRKKIDSKLENEKREGDVSRELESINHDLDTARSLLWARSRDFLVDAEIASETRRARDAGASIPGQPQGGKGEESLGVDQETRQVRSD